MLLGRGGDHHLSRLGIRSSQLRGVTLLVGGTKPLGAWLRGLKQSPQEGRFLPSPPKASTSRAPGVPGCCPAVTHGHTRSARRST